jgi:hypothetical protein
MSKDIWFADYEQKLNELGDDPNAEEKAIEYAEGYAERLQDHADAMRKISRESNE